IEVHCERAFAIDGSMREGQRFTQMPLAWERAAGGPGTANPAGVRADAAPDGFGPIAPPWPPRLGKLHRGLAQWDFRRWQEGPLPLELDASFFNVAPL